MLTSWLSDVNATMKHAYWQSGHILSWTSTAVLGRVTALDTRVSEVFVRKCKMGSLALRPPVLSAKFSTPYNVLLNLVLNLVPLPVLSVLVRP